MFSLHRFEDSAKDNFYHSYIKILLKRGMKTGLGFQELAKKRNVKK
jgi:hypothetical protein